MEEVREDSIKILKQEKKISKENVKK